MSSIAQTSLNELLYITQFILEKKATDVREKDTMTEDKKSNGPIRNTGAIGAVRVPSGPKKEEDQATLIRTAFAILLSNTVDARLGRIEVPTQEEPRGAAINMCEPPSARDNPEYVLNYKKSLSLIPLILPGTDPDKPLPPYPDFFVSCTRIPGRYQVRGSAPNIDFHVGLDLSFEQLWKLIELKIGDLSSTMSLAPSEQLTLEFLTSQRKVLERTTVDSTEELTSVENTISDKEVVNVARSSVRTENWNASASGGINLGFFKIEGGGGASGSTTENIQSSLEHIREATRKSSNSLKVLHKIEVKGVTETLIQNRMTRVIKNPYPDRTLTLNVFQLLKRFSVKTELREIRPALILQINRLIWDDNFIVSNSQFLQENLIDSSLLEELPTAIKGAREVPPPPELGELIELSKLALQYLFDEKNIFGLPHVFIGDRQPGTGTPEERAKSDPNLVKNSFDPQLQFIRFPSWVNDNLIHRMYRSGYGAAADNSFLKFYTTLNYLYNLYEQFKRDTEANRGDKVTANAIAFVFTLKAEIDANWNSITDQTALRRLLYYDAEEGVPGDNRGRFTEVFRRLSGFSAMVNGMLKYRLDTVAEWAKQLPDRERSRASTIRLQAHLNCNMHYYIERYLSYIYKKTEKQAIIDFVNQAIDSTNRIEPNMPMNLRRLFDLSRVYTDGIRIVIPGSKIIRRDENNGYLVPKPDSSEPENIRLENIRSVVDSEIRVPVSDGVHLEVAPGKCVLDENLPEEKEKKEREEQEKREKKEREEQEKREKPYRDMQCISGVILVILGGIILGFTAFSPVPYYTDVTVSPQFSDSPFLMLPNGKTIATIIGLGLTTVGSYLLKSCGKMFRRFSDQNVGKQMSYRVRNTPPS